MDLEEAKEEIKKLKAWYSEQIKNKDEEIERLLEINRSLLGSAIRQAELNTPPIDKNPSTHGKPYYKIHFPKDSQGSQAQEQDHSGNRKTTESKETPDSTQ